MYYIIVWDTKDIIAEYTDLKEAKKAARKMGSQVSWISNSGFEPVAYVGVKIGTQMCVEYNPRFNKLVTPENL